MYIELFIILNFYIDFILLVMTSILIKKQIHLKKLFLASFISGLSSLFLFMKISIIELLIISFLVSLLIIKIAFNQLKAVFFFYLNGILIGGIMFFIKHYFQTSVNLNFILLIIILPIIVIIYKRKVRFLKTNYNLNYQIKLNYQGQKITLNSFLDTGNNLIDPYFHKPVILVNDYLIKSDKYFYIPYKGIAESGVIKAFYLDKFEIIGFKTIKNVVVGLLPEKLKIKNVDCLLNNQILEEYHA